jgi:hypothetical protein
MMLVELALVVAYVCVLMIKSCDLSSEVCSTYGIGDDAKGEQVYSQTRHSVGRTRLRRRAVALYPPCSMHETCTMLGRHVSLFPLLWPRDGPAFARRWLHTALLCQILAQDLLVGGGSFGSGVDYHFECYCPEVRHVRDRLRPPCFSHAVN